MTTTTLGTTIQGTPRAGRILIVEDDPNSRWALCALLKRLGYDCRTACDGREALAAVLANPPQVILMDLMMPVLDGLEATRRLKADAATRGIPIVAVSANDTPDGRSSARAAGCDAFVPKPVVMDDLLVCLRAHLPR